MNGVTISSPKVIIAISYKDLYSDYDTVNPENFIKDIPTIPLLKFVVERFNKVLYAYSDTKTQLSLLREYNPKLPVDIRRKVFRFTQKHNNEVLLYAYESVTMLIQMAIQNYVPLENEDEDYIADEEYEKIYKTLLYCNQIWTDNQLIPDEVSEKSLINASILIDLPVIEFKGFKDFRFQLFKALRFFEFCESNDSFKTYLPYFLKEKKVNSWIEYEYKLFTYYGQSFNSSVYNTTDTFVEQFVINLNDTEVKTLWSNPRNGMLYLRDKFFFPISKDQSILLNANLLVDKIYQAIKFDFWKVVDKYKLLTPTGKQYKDFPNFNSTLGELFSESYLLYHILRKTYLNHKCILYNGKTLKHYWEDGEPDFYMRQGDSIFLFEHKDLLLGDSIKFSGDINRIRNEVTKRLCFDDGVCRKGAGQLLYSINRIINEGIIDELDSEIPNTKFVFPIITVTDSAFSATGINAIVIESFMGLLEKYQFNNIFISFPIIIDYNDLLSLSYRLNKGILVLKDVLLDYITRSWKNLQSFSAFVMDEYKAGIKDMPNEYLFPEFVKT